MTAATKTTSGAHPSSNSWSRAAIEEPFIGTLFYIPTRKGPRTVARAPVSFLGERQVPDNLLFVSCRLI